MSGSMADIQSAAAEIIGEAKKEEERTNHSMKIYMVSLFHRATLKKVNLDICEAPLNTTAFSKALRYDNTRFYLQTCYTCLSSPAAEHHHPLADAHFTVPQRVEG